MDEMIWHSRDYVRASACGEQVCMTPISVLQCIEDAVTAYFGQMGIDNVSVLKNFNVFWVFVKNAIRVDRAPRWGEAIDIDCRIIHRRSRSVRVLTSVTDTQAKPLFVSLLEMCVLDRGSGEILRLDNIVPQDPAEVPAGIEVPKFLRFPHEELPTVGQVTVRRSSIDMSHHVNNVEYMRFLVDALTPGQAAFGRLTGMELHYKNQSYLDDCLEICSAPAEDGLSFSIRRQGAEVLHCRLFTDNRAEGCDD